MKSCLKCGFSNDDSAKFCKQCGERLEIYLQKNKNICSNCGMELPEGAAFCKYCGTSVVQTQKQNSINPQLENYRSQPNSNYTNTNIAGSSVSSVKPQNVTVSKPTKSTPNIYHLVFGGCIAVVVVIIVFMALASSGSNNSTADINEVQGYSAQEDTNDDYSYDFSNDIMDDDYGDKEQESSIETGIETTTQEMEASEYVLPTSNSEYLIKDDLVGLTARECRLARNEIYARHGRMFLDEELQNYFNSFDWYHPTIEPDDFQESMLNQYEVANRDLIVAYETEQGYY